MTRHSETPWAWETPHTLLCDHHRTDGRPLCPNCLKQLHQALTDLPATLHQLEVARRRDIAFTDHGTRHRNTNESPLPWDNTAATHHQTITHTLTKWAQTRSGRPQGLNRLLRHPEATQHIQTLTAALTAARHHIDRPADLHLIGYCPDCDNELWAERTHTTTQCPQCGTHWDTQTLKQWALHTAPNLMLPTSDILTALPHLTRRRLHHWINTQGITREPRTIPTWNPTTQTITTHTRWVYRLGDILTLDALTTNTLTTNQAATYLGLHPQHIRRLTAQGQLTPTNTHRSNPNRYTRQELDQWATTRRRKTQP